MRQTTLRYQELIVLPLELISPGGSFSLPGGVFFFASGLEDGVAGSLAFFKPDPGVPSTNFDVTGKESDVLTYETEFVLFSAMF